MKTQAQIILAQLNKDYKVSDEKIAAKLGRSAMTIYRWRLGKNKPSVSELQVLKRIWTGHITNKDT